MNSSYGGGNWPPVTKNLIIINVLIWLAEYLFRDFGDNTLIRYLGLHFYGSDMFNIAQPFTYMFLHAPNTITHIFFNMFSLWMFGRLMEQVWGSKRFLLFYLVCGVGAAIVQEAVWALSWEHDYIQGIARLNGLTYEHMKQVVDSSLAAGDAEFMNAVEFTKNSMVTVGASGAIFGILLGFAFVFPNMPMYLFFIPIPIKAKYMVAGYAVLEFFFGVGGKLDSVAHFAHLGGMIFGLIILLYWKKKGMLRGDGFY